MRRVIVALLLGCPGTALAAGFSTTDRSVVAMGSGGAGTARAEDPGANAYIPAAAATTRGVSASLGAVIATARLDATGPGWSFESDGAPVVPPLAHVRAGFEDFAIGASLAVPFGSRVVWPAEWPGRFELTSARLTVMRASAFGAMSFGRLAIAIGPFADFGSLALTRAIDFIDVEGSTSIDTRANGFGVAASVFYRANAALDLGLSYQSRSRLAFSGYADFDVPAEFRGRAPDQALDTVIRLPDRLAIGGLYRLTDELELVADVELVLWSSVDALVLDFASEATSDVVQPRAWRTTVTPRAGAAWRPAALGWLTVRGGAFFDPSPVPGATASPSSPDSSRVGLTLGVGAALPLGFSIDAGYQLALLTGVASEMETASLAPGVAYGGHIHLFGASIAWQSGR